MMGALAPFSYLVIYIVIVRLVIHDVNKIKCLHSGVGCIDEIVPKN